MKITILKETFLEKISFASRFTSSKLSSINSLQGVCLKGEKKTLHFYATNLNFYYHTQVNLENNLDFTTVIEPKKICEFLSFLIPGKIDIEIEKNKIVITQGETRGEFAIFSPEDYPFPPMIKSKPKKIATDLFLKNLPLVIFATSPDETRPVLTGVNFVIDEEKTVIVATDGFRLSLLKMEKIEGLPSMIVPSSFLNQLLPLAKDKEEILFNYSLEEKIINFQFGDHDLYSRLIEGEYPPFEKVIPVETKTKVVIDKQEFFRKIKLISVFARELSNVIIFEIKKESMIIKPKTEKSGGSFTTVEAKVDGDEIKIAFNFKFLIDFLSHLGGEKIIIELNRSDSPTVFKSDKNPNFLHIIMPVRIQE